MCNRYFTQCDRGDPNLEDPIWTQIIATLGNIRCTHQRDEQRPQQGEIGKQPSPSRRWRKGFQEEAALDQGLKGGQSVDHMVSRVGKAVADCGAPAELKHGQITFSTRNKLTTYKSEIRYSCQQPYYKMLHNITGIYTCSAQGVWMNEVLGRSQPTCLPVCGLPKFSRKLMARIFNGRPAQKGTTPWIAMLSHWSEQPFCGGSLLGSSWIVTAAHCLHQLLNPEYPALQDSDLIRPSDFKIILGKHWRRRSDENEQHLRVKRFFLHPLYDPNTFENDVALVELLESPVLNDYVMPICLPEGPPQEGAMVIVSGWGKQFLQRFPETLMEIEIPIVDHRTCQEAYAPLKKKVTRDMICAGEKEGGKDACSGDSGGPMVTLDKATGQWYLVGTVSWGDDCGKKDRYGVYSYIYYNTDWIQRVTRIRN